MTIRHMKIFVSVYQAQSITRAAEATTTWPNPSTWIACSP